MVNDKFNPGCFSPDIRTRLEIAQKGRPEDLDRLVSDDFWPVRLAVARRGLPRHLEVPKNDPEPYVRQMAVARLKGMPLPKP